MIFIFGIIYIIFSFALLTAIHPKYTLFKLILLLVLPILSLQWFPFGYGLIVFALCFSKLFGYDPQQPKYNQSFFVLKHGYLADNIGFIIMAIGIIMLIIYFF